MLVAVWSKIESWTSKKNSPTREGYAHQSGPIDNALAFYASPKDTCRGNLTYRQNKKTIYVERKLLFLPAPRGGE